MLLLYINTDTEYGAISVLTPKDIIEELFGGTGRRKLIFLKIIFFLPLLLWSVPKRHAMSDRECQFLRFSEEGCSSRQPVLETSLDATQESSELKHHRPGWRE